MNLHLGPRSPNTGPTAQRRSTSTPLHPYTPAYFILRTAMLVTMPPNITEHTRAHVAADSTCFLAMPLRKGLRHGMQSEISPLSLRLADPINVTTPASPKLSHGVQPTNHNVQAVSTPANYFHFHASCACLVM